MSSDLREKLVTAVDFGHITCNTVCMEQGRLLPDLSGLKPLIDQTRILVNDAHSLVHSVHDKIDSIHGNGLLIGVWLGGITVAVVMLFLFTLNLARRK